MWLFLALALSHQPCVTRCGLRGPHCAELQEVEDRALDAFDRNKVVPRFLACALLKGWRVKQHKRTKHDRGCHKPSWRGTGELRDDCLLGYTHIEERTLEVEEAFMPQGSLAHELLHALDHRLQLPPGHCAWTERHRKQALFEATSMPDNTVEVCTTSE